MPSLSTTRRQIKQAASNRELEDRSERLIKAADHFSDDDRAVAEALEARELFAAFVAEEF
jgi:hypothetical protein